MSDVIRCPHCLKYIDATITPTECRKCGNSLTQADVADGSKSHVDRAQIVVDSRITRFFAELIDLAVMLAGIMVVAFAADIILSKDSPVSWLLILASCFVMVFLYPSICDYAFGGTLGKRLIGIRVVDQKSSSSLTFAQAFKRNIYKILILGSLILVTFVLGGIPLIVALFFPNFWSEHNKLSSVVVVYR